MQSKITPIVVLCLTFGVLLPSGYAEEPKSPIVLAQPQEELTAQDVFAYLWDQTVVTVSRREQKISEAPASVTVITADDIKRSGAVNIQDVLRSVAGLEVMGMTQTMPSVGIRGFNSGFMSRTVLVLLNGNPVYEETTMSPSWNMTPVTLPEIERIEIVRGPGSALWGANAYSGVINIITKSPDKFPTLQISQTTGELGATYTNFIQARKTGKFQYKFQYAHEQMRNLTLNSKALALKRNVYSLDLRHTTSKQREFSVQFGLTHPHNAVVIPAYNIVESRFLRTFLHLTYKTGDSWIKIRQNYIDLRRLRQTSPFVAEMVHPSSEKNISTEAQTTKRFRRLGILTYGAEYKFVDAFFADPERRTQGLGSLFAQYDLSLTGKLSLITGARLDTHPQTKTTSSPRASLMYKFTPYHNVRVTGATAYRRPAYSELYPKTVLKVPFWPFILPYVGNEQVKPQRIRSLEIGYTGKLIKDTRLTILVFRNYLDNFISLSLIGGTLTAVNRDKYIQDGAEIELETAFSRNLKGFVNYAFDRTVDIFAANRQGGGDLFHKYKINAGIGWMPPSGLYGNLTFNFVDDAFGQTFGDAVGTVEAYRNWDLNLGYRFSKKLQGLELGLNTQNILNKTRLEHPAGDTFKRRVVATISYAFKSHEER